MSSKRKRAGMWIVVLVVMAVMVSLPIMAAPTQETPVYWESGASTTCSGHETEECEDPTSCTVTAQEDGCAVSTSGLPQSCDYRSGIIIFPFQDCRDETCTFSDYETCDDGNSDTINDCDPNTGCLYYPCGDGQCNVGNINSEDASTCPEDCCTDSDGDGYYIDGGDCGPVDCDDSDPDVHPGASEACDDSIDNDCDGMTDCDDSECSDHPACECTFDNAYWSHEETTAGVRVKMTVEGTNCDGKEIMFNIYEDDLINDEDTSDEFVVKPKAVFDSGKAEAGWYAIYTPDGPGGLFDPPEYYFNAQLSEDSAVSIRSQGPGSNGLLKVWPNQRPYNETPFLIKPNGGEVYNESALVTWNPAIDPENDTIIYSLYYSNTSGNTWHGPIVQDYGFINTIEGEENLLFDFDNVNVDSNVVCWGNNDRGQAEDYNGGDAVDVSAGWCHTCAVLEDGDVECWGCDGPSAGYDGGDAVDVSSAAPAVSIEGGFSCALLEGGDIACWGDNNYGQSEDYNGGDAVDVSAGWWHACAVLEDGNVICWGSNLHGRSNGYQEGDAIKVGAGAYHTCAVLEDGDVACWGSDYEGQSAGYDGGDAVDVSSGRYHSCAVLEDGDVACWGGNRMGQSEDYYGGDAVDVSAGNNHSCAVLEDGDVACWGDNRVGQSEDYYGGDAVDVSAGAFHTCSVIREKECSETEKCPEDPSEEICDFFDNNRNGIIDDIETTPTRGRALGGPQSEDADAVETDEGFGVVWKQWNRTTLKWDVFFVETDKHGMPLIDSVMVSDPSSGSKPVMPSVAWDSANDVFAVAWDSRSDEEVYISIVDGSDYSATEPVMVSEDDGKKSILPEVEWSGSSFGVAWLDASKGAAYTTNLFFREVSADVSMQPIKQITAGDDARGFPEIEWNNDNGKYAVAWERDDYGSYGIMVTLFDADGSNTVSKDIFYEYGTQAMEPSITWNSERNEYALVWRDDRDDSYDLYFTRLAPDGEKLLPEVALTDDNSAQQFPSITWSSEAGEYGIAWMQDYGYFTRVVPERESILPGKRYQEFADMKVTKPTSWRPKLFHTGAAYRMVYSDDRARFIRLNDCGKRLNMTTKYLDIPKVANVYKAGMAFTGENVFNLAVYAGNDTTASYTNSGTFSDVADFRKQVNESVKSCDEDIGGTCKVPINIAADNGEVTVSSIDVGFTNYLWNTWLMPEGFNYRIKLIAEELPVCGNGKMEADEECDDGNVADGDGCSGDCTIE